MGRLFPPNDPHESYADGTIYISLQKMADEVGWLLKAPYTTAREPQNGY
jgi:hypothetical protein